MVLGNGAGGCIWPVVERYSPLWQGSHSCGSMRQLVTVCLQCKEKGYKYMHVVGWSWRGRFCPFSEILGHKVLRRGHCHQFPLSALPLSLLTQHITGTDGSGPLNNRLGKEEQRNLNKDFAEC